MKALVTGGAASGKSAFAERLACQLSDRRIYLATMASRGREAQARIRRHRSQRAGLGFATVECAGSVPSALCGQTADDVVLLDDLGNLVAQALFDEQGTMANPSAVLHRLERELCALADAHAHVVLVGNEVGSSGPSPYPTTNDWIRLMGTLNCRMAARFDMVVEVACGCPNVLKGDLP